MIADAVLKATLERHLSRHFSRECSIVSFSRRPHPRRSSFVLEELDVELHGGDRFSVVFKNIGPDALLSLADRGRTAVDYDPECEIRAYRDVLSPDLGTPACYGAELDPPKGRYWLFLEKVVGMELVDIGEFARWEEAAQWLVRFQRRHSDSNRLPTGFQRYDANYYRLWLERAVRAVPALQRRFGLPGPAFQTLRSGYGAIVAQLTDLPLTVVHGDFYPSNIILVSASVAQSRLCPVDWGAMALGPGLIDLAALVSGSWSESQRKRLVKDYWRCLQADRMSFDEFLSAMLCCRVFLSLQWLASCSGREELPPGVQSWVREADFLYRQAGQLLTA